MTFYTLRHINGAWSLFVLLPVAGSFSFRFSTWQRARASVRRVWPKAIELTEAEMWRETMKREMEAVTA